MNNNQNDFSLNIFTGEEDNGFYENRHHHRYEATPYGALDLLFSTISIRPNETFVDVGCGKGRTLFFVVERFGCKGIGIEMDDHFYRECLLNKESFGESYPEEQEGVSFYHGLADHYPISANDSVFYFFNPFSIEIFRAFTYRLIESVSENPRELTLILYYPSSDYVHFLAMETYFEEVECVKWQTDDPRELFLVYKYQSFE
ncbi:class I SAM-dependent methyltransferase [Mangrovibacillus cuniculi]|uniref:Class I SAM-dependent methyltransferase n=1 Tax=Mangrovibacillus cuniculi TaxID=2593652 RepID=A0A7S8C9H5_9BACI|nr:class I SAM-dependent methyltransferase [Mangrovibacillus cuniculi]QPC45703.1 class I SAM-dependent methyltransferase [Mangrovibacillus cuniculi]